MDVVLAQPGMLPIDVIRDPHLALSGRTLSNVFETFVRDNAAVKNVLARNEQAATLSTADQGMIQAAFQAQTSDHDRSRPHDRAGVRVPPGGIHLRRLMQLDARQPGSSARDVPLELRRALGIISRTTRSSADPGDGRRDGQRRRRRCRPGRSCSGRSTPSPRGRPASSRSAASRRCGRRAGGELVVDFQGLRTVERVQSPVAISQIRQWAGTQFANADRRGQLEHGQAFTEVLTERLLVQFAGDARRRRFRRGGSVAICRRPPTSSSSSNGTRAWFNAGTCEADR